MRKSGILLAISSLPGRYGIGTFSKNAYAFVDFLDRAGQSLWQILPLGPTGYGDSPYQSFSTFAGNPYYIDLDEFIDKGWLSKKDCEAYDYGASDSVDYELIYKAKFALLKKAYKKSDISKDKEFVAFKKENAFWLDDYALYMSIKDEHLGAGWTTWDDGLKLRKKSALDKYRKKLADQIDCYCFQQYFFYRQWKALKSYANEKGIQIVHRIWNTDSGG